MISDERPSPYQLWQQANGDGAKYRELLRLHGHLIPGEYQAPECGWDPRRERECEG